MADAAARPPDHPPREARPRRPRSQVERRLGAGGHLPVRARAAARRGLLDRHAAAHGERLAARRPRLLLHPHRRRRALPAHARQVRLLSDGVGRQRAAHRAAGAELLRRPLRSVAAVRPVVRAAREAGQAPISMSRPNFIELCARLTAEDEKAFEDLWRHLGLSVDWSRTYATIGRPAQRVSQTAFLRLLRTGQAYQLEAPTLWDVDFRTAVAQAELEDREQPGAYHRLRFGRRRRLVRGDRHHAARAAAGVRGARGASRRRPLPAALRQRGRDAALRRAGAGEGASAGRSREGQRHRDDLHVRRSHRRDLVARAGAAGARRDPAQRRAQAGDVRQRRLAVARRGARRRAPTTSSPVCRSAKARTRIVELLRESRRSGRRAAPDHAPGEVLREGRPAARDRHQPAVVHQDDGVPRARCWRAAASCSGTRSTWRTASRTG